MMKKFSDRLVSIMKEQGLSQSALAEAMGIGQSTVSGWMKGSVPQPRMLLALAAQLSVPVAYLRDGTGTKELTEQQKALGPSRLAGGHSIKETAAAYRAHPHPEVDAMLAAASFTAAELLTWAEIRVLRREIENRLNAAIVDPSDDRRIRLVNRIEEYFATCGSLKPDAAKIMKEEFERESSRP